MATLEVQAETTIRRPRSEVAAFMFDAVNDPQWVSTVIESRPQEPGPLRQGSKLDRVSEYMGRRLAYVVEVVGGEPGLFLEMTSSVPFEVKVRYELEDAPWGTNVSIRVRGGEGGPLPMGGMMVKMAVKRALNQDLGKLKRILENPAG